MKIVVRVVFLVLGLTFTLQAQQVSIEKFQWLEGSWQRINKNVVEVWERVDQQLLGSSFKVVDLDTTTLETISLACANGECYYTADVAGSQPPVVFKITTIHKSGFVAENPAHDFPKIIRYAVYQENDEVFLEATIEGNGKSMSFLFSRRKQ